MEFLDRTEELTELKRVLDPKSTPGFAVVFGRRRLGKSTLIKKATALSAPIDRLIHMNYRRREIPFGESPKKSKKGIYRINDPRMDFYYTYVIPNMSSIGRERKGFVMEEMVLRTEGGDAGASGTASGEYRMGIGVVEKG